MPTYYRAVLEKFVAVINASGGLLPAEDALGPAPAGDPEWLDLADVYLEACRALDVQPLYVPADEAEPEEPPCP